MESDEKPDGIYDAFKLDVMQSHKEGNAKNDGKNDGKNYGKAVRAGKSSRLRWMGCRQTARMRT